ncbi:wax ester/triacylglycerol synthase family O-acyltransferase [Qaidamihabitans albus]|uniref:wax ester/triacylglycerol synthase family O-acyltransferase n=1 Tax=Qaidamihabitans albus TaxID=2795733 RepID=UPI0018F23BC2|nr:wax ester/triacylglycerol synthase family O-acyltransferase [Qaidamihabitans albus]
MNRLSPLDSLFLDIEDADPHVSLAIASVLVADGPVPSSAEVCAALADRLAPVSRARQRVRHASLGLARVWTDDSGFAVANHVHRIGVPAPGDDDALGELIAYLMERRLDRDRPLWECWVIDGLAGRQWALLFKVHHCITDGVAGTRLLGAVQDTGEPPRLRTAGRSTGPGPLPTLVHALRSPVEFAGQVAGLAAGAGSLVRALLTADDSPLNGPVGGSRRFALAHASVADIREISAAFGITVNDVALAVIAGAFRALLLRRDGRAPNRPLHALVPVSLHAHDQDVVGNRISWLLPPLPVDLADPVARLFAVHERTRALKQHHQSDAGDLITALARLVPQEIRALSVRLAGQFPQRAVTTVTTNVPGPARPITFLGRRVTDLVPFVPIAMRLRTGIAFLSYCDRLTFGITTDSGSVPEATPIARCIEGGVTELLQAARSLRAATA